MKGNCYILLLALVPLRTIAQPDPDVQIEQIIADIYEQLSEESEEELDFTTFFEDLYALSQSPINLNTATESDLKKLQFLSDMQIDNILYYIYSTGNMQTIYELQLIDGLASWEIRNLLPFVQAGEQAARKPPPTNLRNMFHYGKNELLFRLDRGIEQKRGYQTTIEEDEAGNQTTKKTYAGDPFYTSLRYRFNYANRVQFGFSAEKDAGEQFWGDYNKGYDFYSAFLQLNDIWKFKTIVAGDYRANFGLGLVVRSEFGFGKSAYVLNVTPRNSGLKKFSSTDEYNFFRGAGATIRLGPTDISVFYSNKNIDADVTDGKFSSITKTGLHRTETERAKKHNVNQQVIGCNAGIDRKHFHIGLTAICTLFSDTLVPDPNTYNALYFSGTRLFVAGTDYRFRINRLTIFGETAISSTQGIATLNGLSYTPVSTVGLVMLHRYYSPKFDNLFATAFGENSRTNNEQGVYLGTEIYAFRRWKFSAYADGFRFMFTKYGTDAPSDGFDYLLRADFSATRTISMYWQLKWERKSSNLSSANTNLATIVPVDKASVRYYLTYGENRLTFKNIVEGNLSANATDSPTFGIMALQDVSYRFANAPLTIDLRFQVFDAPAYNNRIYSYEKDILYAFSIPMYYGRGARYYLNLKYELSNQLCFWFKVGQTVYADGRESVGTSYETIEGNRTTTVRCLVRWKFGGGNREKRSTPPKSSNIANMLPDDTQDSEK